MNKNLLFVLLLFFSCSIAHGQTPLCDSTYWNMTYDNGRLKVYNGCATVTGIIINEIPPSINGDGDYHIYIQTDTQYQWMTSYRDTNFTKFCVGVDSSLYRLVCTTCLNVEEVCKGAPSPLGGSVAAVDSACNNNFNDTVFLPNNGEYVSATGPFVYDTYHCWNELHPISRMFIVTVTNIPEPEGSLFADGMKVFPQPASKELEFEFARAPHAITLIKIYNAAGRQLFIYGLAETSTLHLDVSTWPAGEYPYTIVAQEQGKKLRSGVISVVH